MVGLCIRKDYRLIQVRVGRVGNGRAVVVSLKKIKPESYSNKTPILIKYLK